MYPWVSMTANARVLRLKCGFAVRGSGQPSTGGPIEPADKEIKQDPYKLPAGFVWDTCNVDDEAQMAERDAKAKVETASRTRWVSCTMRSRF